ncbi:isocitrate lyase/PEP mutase family protein [Microbacterium invictum]|jgi:2-methylisocitrate lyase-like PEP mutase family enzyme|uniref:Isocitrate lyase/phosphoenolpyruvate mutase family protein n=1 Tax=Microbacterium invictum TaxID=515415 RepID=A0ABZ0VH35_9MICO|nr:isocitrate lyase/phosphoenolpyruvate mutase family protein [Microbacterium invictum]WQB71107.1 isocitrate lyase/phosphoenolpyruvate mutase family protein [Microbacterium invictum]
MTADTTLRARFAALQGAPLFAAGGGTPLEALLTEQAGFDAFYLSGYAVAAWRHGLPDIGLLGMSDTAQALRAVARVVDIPIVCDADTGYGDVIAVTANVRELEAIGAAAIQIEDQEWPKKCGHMEGKTVIARDDAVRKVAAAVEARRDPETMIIARTDALAPLGIDEAIARAQAFAAVGADLVFVDAPPSKDDLRRISEEVGGLLVANISEGGLTPTVPLEDLAELGYGFVMYPTSALRVAARTMGEFLAELKASGTSVAWRERMHGLDGLNEIVRLDDYLEVDARFAATPVPSA